MTEIEMPLLLEARRVRREFLTTMEPHRPRLYAYCRRLTGNVWDAEDLVQETLAKAFARAAEEHNPISNPLGWLIRVATNAYVDSVRRARAVPTDDIESVSPAGPTTVEVDGLEVRDALKELMTVLPPQERAALVLKDVFDLSLAEIASMAGMTEGAVKSALHRGRGTLAGGDREARLAERQAPDRRVLEAAASAFTAYDVDGLLAVLRDDAVMDLVGMVYETGPDQMRRGTLRHTFDTEDDVRYRAEVREFEGEPVVAVWSSNVDGSGEPGISEVWRCATADGLISSIANFFFCPEVVAEVAASWGAPTVLHGYRYS